jgi:hypothetical protein
MKIIIYFILLLLCGNTNCVTKNEYYTRDKLHHKKAETSEFQNFYSDFRKALIQNDSLALREMTNFPLEVWGFNDNDPKFKIDASQFMYFLNKSISISVEEDQSTGKSINTLDLFKMNDSVPFQSDYSSQSIGMLEFKKVDEFWKLYLIYTDTR